MQPITPLLTLPVCTLGVRLAALHIEEIVFLPPGVMLQRSAHPLANLLLSEMGKYLENAVHTLCLPLMNRGTVFQNRVWQTISTIESGQTRTYGDISREIGSAPRAVGQACGANPFPIVVPCHRVTGKQSLGGFAKQNTDWLIQTKQWLLAHESKK